MIAELPPSPQEVEDDWKWYDSPAREERDKRTEERLEALEAEVRQLQASREELESKYIDSQDELERLTDLVIPVR
jgi:uncharacterized protein YlxW (UPF0749 family)